MPKLSYPEVYAGKPNPVMFFCCFVALTCGSSISIDTVSGFVVSIDSIRTNVTLKHLAMPFSPLMRDMLRPKSVRFFMAPLRTMDWDLSSPPLSVASAGAPVRAGVII